MSGPPTLDPNCKLNPRRAHRCVVDSKHHGIDRDDLIIIIMGFCPLTVARLIKQPTWATDKSDPCTAVQDVPCLAEDGLGQRGNAFYLAVFFLLVGASIVKHILPTVGSPLSTEFASRCLSCSISYSYYGPPRIPPISRRATTLTTARAGYC